MPGALQPDRLPLTAFYLLAVVAIVSSVLVVTRRNPVAQAMNLILTLLSLAGIFALLQAHFVAAIQILVYAGAILVVFIFVIMLLNLSDEEIGPARPTILKGLAVLTVAAMIWGASVRCADDMLALPTTVLDGDSYGTLREVGMLIYRDYLLAFELTSLFILVGIVGAILLASRKVRGGGDA